MFVGRIGEQRNIPVLRIGTIAAMRDEPLRTQYGYHEAFLVEARSIDGLSGSPVCVHLPVGRLLPRNMAFMPDPNHRELGFYLAGMVLGANRVYGPTYLIDIASTTSTRPKSRQR
jgi:hypothetical protein